jgi:hypothetical protein
MPSSAAHQSAEAASTVAMCLTISPSTGQSPSRFCLRSLLFPSQVKRNCELVNHMFDSAVRPINSAPREKGNGDYEQQQLAGV